MKETFLLSFLLVKGAYSIVKIVLSVMKIGRTKLEKEYYTYRILKKYYKTESNNDFKTVYFNTLYKFEETRGYDVVRLFSNKDVMLSFETEFKNENDWSFKVGLIHHLHTNKAFRNLKDIEIDIEKELNEFKSLFKSEIQNVKTPNEIEVSGSLDEISSGVETLSSKFDKLSESSSNSFLRGYLLGDMNFSKDLMESNKPKQALDYLNKFKNEKWGKSDDLIKYKTLVNIGICLFRLDEEQKGIESILNAEKFNPSDPKALGFYAFAQALSNNKTEFNKIFDKAIAVGNVDNLVYASLITIDDGSSSIEELLTKIPKSIYEETQIAFSLGQYAFRRNEAEKGFFWMDKAIENDSRNSYDLKAILGVKLLEHYCQPEKLMSKQLNKKDISQINRGIELLNYSWGEIKEIEIQKVNSYWILNSGLGKMALGDLSGAYDDVSEAARLKRDFDTLKHLGIICFEMSEFKQSLELFTEIIESHQTHEDHLKIYLMKADTLNALKEYDKAIESVEFFLKKESDIRFINEARCILFEIHKTIKDYEQAQSINELILSESPNSVIGYYNAVKLYKLIGENEEVNKYLNIASKIVMQSEIIDDKYLVSKLLIENKDYQDAINILEPITDKTILSRYLRNLTICYLNIGDYKSVIEICEFFRYEEIHDEMLVNLETMVYHTSRNLKKAIEICNWYLAKDIESVKINIRLAILFDENRELDKCKKILARLKNVDGLNLDTTFRLSDLFIRHSLDYDGLEMAYNYRETFYNDSNAHSYYISIFLELNEALIHDLETSSGILNSCITIKQNDGKIIPYVLVDNEKTNLLLNELFINSEFGQKLLNTKVGNILTLDDSFGIPGKIEVIGIKSKYIHARDVSFQIIDNPSSDSSGIKSFQIVGETNEEKREFMMEFISNMVGKKQKYSTELNEYYSSGALTLESYSNIIDKNQIEVWKAFISSNEKGIITTPKSKKWITSNYEKLKRTKLFILDLKTLLTFYSIGLLKKTEKVPFEFIVGQKTIDSLNLYIKSKERFEANGSINFFKQGNDIVKYINTPEDSKRDLESAIEILNWIDINCEIKASIIFLEMQKKEREKYTTTIGETSLESILLSQEYNTFLIIDEKLIQTIGKEEFSIESINTSLFSKLLHNLDCINEDYFLECKVKLINLNFKGIEINAEVIMRSIVCSNYRIEEPFTKVTQILEGGNSQDNSAILVLTVFLKKLYLEVHIEQLRLNVTLHLLDTIIKKRKLNLVMLELGSQIEKQFNLIPIQRNELIETINLWMKQQIIS